MGYNPWGHKESDMTERLRLKMKTRKVEEKFALVLFYY